MASAKGEKRSFDKLRTSGEGALLIADEAIQAIRSATRNAHPREACGLLLGQGARVTAFVETRNTHPAPETHFEIDAQALIDAHRAEREGGPQVLGYFHSHPRGEPCPSETDQASSAKDGKVWAIAAGGEVMFWRDEPDGFHALSYEIVGG
ncbi:MAG: M67 family metallopeptidase [Pseudomonadota bacterium]